MRLHILTLLFLIFELACEPTTRNEYNVYLVDNGDTTKYFHFTISQNYQLFKKQEIDKLLRSESLERIRGEFLIGLTDTESQDNRYLVFRAPDRTSFADYSDPLSNLLTDEIELNNYNIEILENYIDSLTFPVSQHHILALIDNISRDTLLFQETAYGMNNERLSFAILTYKDRKKRDEMELIINEFIEKSEKE